MVSKLCLFDERPKLRPRGNENNTTTDNQAKTQILQPRDQNHQDQMPSLREANRKFSRMNGSGCIFEHYGRIPEAVYKPECFRVPLEETVYKNDLTAFKQLVQEGADVSIRLKIGEMTCVEYCAMMGYEDMLRALVENSVHHNTLTLYFSLADHVERAYMISRNKNIFFDQEALVEVNRYEAALYTAVEYNQPGCTRLMVKVLGPREPGKHNFITENNSQERLSAAELAQVRGHTECYEILRPQKEDNALVQTPPLQRAQQEQS